MLRQGRHVPVQGDVPHCAQGRRVGRPGRAGQGLRRALVDRAAMEVLHEQIAAGLARRAHGQQQQRPLCQRHQKQVPCPLAQFVAARLIELFVDFFDDAAPR